MHVPACLPVCLRAHATGFLRMYEYVRHSTTGIVGKVDVARQLLYEHTQQRAIKILVLLAHKSSSSCIAFSRRRKAFSSPLQVGKERKSLLGHNNTHSVCVRVSTSKTINTTVSVVAVDSSVHRANDLNLKKRRVKDWTAQLHRTRLQRCSCTYSTGRFLPSRGKRHRYLPLEHALTTLTYWTSALKKTWSNFD